MKFFAALGFLLALPAYGVPAQFTHQGRILDGAGIPLDGERDIAFRLMESDFGGGPVWEDTLVVSIDNGFYAAVLGTDDDNPLDTEVLEQAPLWLEIQIVGEPAMTPRTPVNSVPYATMATVAEELEGGPVDASEIAISGAMVIDADGQWVGATPSVSWTEISDIPAGFADGTDDDTPADPDTLTTLGVSCIDGDIARWDSALGEWFCDTDQDTWLSGEEVRTYVTEAAIELAVGSSVGGSVISTGEHTTSLAWSDITDVPDGLADGTDADALSSTSCADGQILVFSVPAAAWVCGTDTDTTLSASEVELMIEGMPALTLSSGTTIAGESPLTDSSSVDWSQLVSVPDGFADGDDDSLAGLSCEDGMVVVRRDDAWACETLSASFDADGDGALAWIDCDDSDPDINPDAEEIWYDGVDQDCDGASDYDADGDGFERDEDCDDTNPSASVVGTVEGCAADSCKAIRDASGDESLGNGVYYIKMGEGSGFGAYCDMTTDDGGWTRVMRVDGAARVDRTSSISAGIGYARDGHGLLFETALGNLYGDGHFTELRFRCSRASHERTFHIKTSSAAVINYLTNRTETRPDAVGSFTRLPDDNSILGASPSRWADGKWGTSRSITEHFDDHLVFIGGERHWIAGGHDGRWECDDGGVFSAGDSSWEVFAR